MAKDVLLARQELTPRPDEQAPEVLEGEIVGEHCDLGLSRCTDSDLETTIDPYMSDVYDEKRLITVCPNCAQDNADAI
ncbi:MAG: hypothetical protein QOF58_1713 [Pseudonocardiales bacterium]|jgi:hypothetical protein|nr:hypothetical protein [Pseudonocardiales bacterium]